MIKNYGLLWQRKYVHLGAGRNKGTLLGTRSGIGEVDFREQIGVYVLYDKDLVPVYVGQAGNGNANLFVRLKNHTNDQLWNRWEYFSWFGLRAINSTNKSLSNHDSAEKTYKTSGCDVMNELEGILIASMEPKLNKQGAKLSDAQQFHQTVDENIVELTLEDLSEQLSELQSQFGKIQKKIDKM
jgi:hypothetical protein